VICFNKSDLVDQRVLMAWKAYLEKTLEVVVVCTTCKDDGRSQLELFDSLLKLELGSGEGMNFMKRSILKKSLI